MPLAFESQSHGTVAFGYFNIETDLLLLEDRFFFTDAFGAAVTQLARGAAEADLPGWRVRPRAAIGDLHGAIAGQRLHGLIGATYRRWPFPQDPAAFKQSPEGWQHREAVRALIAPLGTAAELGMTWDREAGTLTLAGLTFDEPGFRRLVAYVDRGGYPRWRDERRPPDVVAMMQAIAGTPLLPRPSDEHG